MRRGNLGVRGAFLACVIVLMTPAVAMAHGMHYDGELSVAGDQGGTVVGETLDIIPSLPDSGCAGAPAGTQHDQGYNDPLKFGCVDIHTVTGTTNVSSVNGDVDIAGADFKPSTKFEITLLNLINDIGDIDGDGTETGPTDLESPFCHALGSPFLGFDQAVRDVTVLATVTTDAAGSFTLNNVPLGVMGLKQGTASVNPPNPVVGHTDLCIHSADQFVYTDPDGVDADTYQGQSVPLNVKP